MKKEKAVKPETSSDAEKKLEQTSSQEKDALAEEELDGVAGGVSPRDAASGLATGKRMHKPIVIH